MLLFIRLQALFIVINNLQQICFAAPRPQRGFCATSAPDESLRTEFRRLRLLGKDDLLDQESRKAIEPIEIETWFHIVSSEASSDAVSDGMIATQVSRNPVSVLTCVPITCAPVPIHPENAN